MNKEDFYSLKINQVIWFKGKEKKIIKLKQEGTCRYIAFDGESWNRGWGYTHKHCSIIEPLEIKHYKKAGWLDDDGNIRKGAILEFMNKPEDNNMELFFSFVKDLVDKNIEV